MESDKSFERLKTFGLSLCCFSLQATNPLTIHLPSQCSILPRQRLHPDTAPPKTSDLEADLLADALAVDVAARVRHDRQALLLRHGPLPDVLQPSGAAQLLGQQGLELGALDGAQQDHRLWWWWWWGGEGEEVKRDGRKEMEEEQSEQSAGDHALMLQHCGEPGSVT